MNVLKVAAIASLCAVFAVGAAAQTSSSGSTTTTKSTTTKTTSKTKASAGETVAPSDLPQPVKDAVMKAHPQGTITAATKSMKGTETMYSVTVKDGAKSMKMTVGADGKVQTMASKKGASSTSSTTSKSTSKTTTSK